jgi:demethylmenaquinone methyltransferase/2-methoxy-6-polyprenyl-1,4-benzoquinol methylase
MFDSIAWRYDFLNHLLSFGIDRIWRRKAVEQFSGRFKNPVILDVATGTADLAISAARTSPGSITGIDISEKMLAVARRKINARGLSELIRFINCDSENICFESNTFDVAMVAFGVRNFSDPLKGLSEMRRVIREGGLVIILEFSRPGKFPFRNIYNFYFRHLLPMIGGWFSKDRKAYRYLNESVMKFEDNEDFMKMMRDAGLKDVRQKRLTFGVASIYTGIKK